jgi:shikimate dehydrogenase
MQARESISANPGELTISTVPGHTDATQLVSDASGELFDVAYSPWPSPIGEVWLANGGSLISGIQMLVWQAIGQIRIFSSGNVAQQLPNEFALSQHMLAAAEM